MLIKRWGITEEEWAYIDSKIKNIGANENSLNDDSVDSEDENE